MVSFQRKILVWMSQGSSTLNSQQVIGNDAPDNTENANIVYMCTTHMYSQIVVKYMEQ